LKADLLTVYVGKRVLSDGLANASHSRGVQRKSQYYVVVDSRVLVMKERER